MTIESSNEPDAFLEFERQGWGSIIEAYDHYLAALTSQSAHTVMALAQVKNNDQVLDVCTGPGMLAAAAASLGANATGLDFSEQVVACAKRNVPEARFINGDAQALPFEDNSFDAVVCGFGIIHLPDPKQALLEMRRVLKPGGHMVATVWEAPHAGNGFGLVFGAIMAHGETNVALPHGPDFFQFSTEEKLIDALRLTGFSKINVATMKQIWQLQQAKELLDGIVQGTVRTRGMLMEQTDENRQKIYDAVIRGMEQHREKDGIYRVPMTALAGVGVKV